MKVARCFLKVILLVLVSHQIFAQNADSTKVIVDRIILIGNKVTKSRIVYRELIFHKNDTLSEFVLDRAMLRSQENLMNTLLFNLVKIERLDDVDNKCTVVITMTERWYIFPIPILEFVDRNFNEWWQTKDFQRINYGFVLTDNNFRGAKEIFQVTARFGYSQKFSFNYVLPYIDKAQTNGLSFMGGYNQNHEVSFTLDNSKLVFYKNEEKYIRKEYYGVVKFNHREHIYNNSNVAVEYRFSSIADEVVELNDRYFLKDANYEQFVALSYRWSRDKRDYKIYSLKGYYFDAEVTKLGFGILKNAPNLLFVSTSFKDSRKIAKNTYFGYYFKGRIAGKSEAPYYNQRALGYNSDFVRGYELYVINGQNYALAKSNLRYAIIPQRVVHAGIIPSEKFNTIPFAVYLNGYVDAGYVQDNVFASTNPLANSIMPGWGAGLDLVTYYNIVIRLEYSFNKFGENGFFLHFTNSLY